MDISLIPIQAIPDQTFVVELNDKDCEIHIYLRYRYMYMDVKVEDEVIVQGQICLNNTNIIQYSHLNFKGNLRFIDTQGNDDPYYSSFGERFALAYVQ